MTRVVLVLVGLAFLAGCSSTETSTSPSPSGPGGDLYVVGLGDSVMAGTACDCAGIVKEYSDALAAQRHRDVTSTNLAANGLVTGEVLDDLLSSRDHRAAVRRADVVLVTIGANDLLPEFDRWERASCDETCYRTPAREMGRTLSRVLDVIVRLRAGRAGTILVTNYWNVFTDGDVARRSGGQAQEDWSTDVTGAANQAICSAAHEQHATCVDLVAPFRGALKGAGQTDPTPMLAGDGDHPNARGVRAIVKALLRSTPAA